MIATQCLTSHTNCVRRYVIEDDADGFQLLLFVDGDQIGGGFFPDSDGTGAVFNVAHALGEAFVGSA